MEKLYLIEGINEVLIDKEIKKIIKDLKDIEIINFDLSNTFIEDVIETLDTYDMFLHKKVVICKHPMFLEEKDENFNLKIFEKYLKNPSDNILIIVANKINNRLKIATLIKKYFKYIKLTDMNLESFVKENLEDYKMTPSLINYFISRVGKDYNNLYQELTKLKLYKLDTKVIEKQDIDLVTKVNLEATIFDLIEAIIKKDKKKSYELYNHFITNGTEIFQILVLVSNQIRLIYNVKVLNTMPDSKISEILGVKEYPVKLARGKGINYSKKELLSLLHKLAILDQDIKSGKQLPNICFLTFVMEM